MKAEVACTRTARATASCARPAETDEARIAPVAQGTSPRTSGPRKIARMAVSACSPSAHRLRAVPAAVEIAMPRPPAAPTATSVGRRARVTARPAAAGTPSPTTHVIRISRSVGLPPTITAWGPALRSAPALQNHAARSAARTRPPMLTPRSQAARASDAIHTRRRGRPGAWVLSERRPSPMRGQRRHRMGGCLPCPGG